jgi:DNA-directed RNA polymerase specialized sigma24 family protein
MSSQSPEPFENNSKKPWYKKTWAKIAIGLVVVIIGVNALNGSDEVAPTVSSESSETTVTESTESESTPEEVAEPTEEAASDESVSQANARRSADLYLSTMPFSRKGLIEQLEFEGYSTEDATYGVDALDVDWKEQAVKSAENYLDTMPFSRESLIEQLEFEGYSTEDAEYGVTQNGL